MDSADGDEYPGMLPPPPGVIPNLTSPESDAWRLIVAGVLCSCLRPALLEPTGLYDAFHCTEVVS